MRVYSLSRAITGHPHADVHSCVADIMHKAYIKRKEYLQRALSALRAQQPARVEDSSGGGGDAGGGSGSARRSPRFAARAAGASIAGGPTTGTPSTGGPSATARFTVPEGELRLTDTVLGSGESGDVYLGWWVAARHRMTGSAHTRYSSTVLVALRTPSTTPVSQPKRCDWRVHKAPCVQVLRLGGCSQVGRAQPRAEAGGAAAA